MNNTHTTWFIVNKFEPTGQSQSEAGGETTSTCDVPPLTAPTGCFLHIYLKDVIQHVFNLIWKHDPVSKK